MVPSTSSVVYLGTEVNKEDNVTGRMHRNSVFFVKVEVPCESSTERGSY